MVLGKTALTTHPADDSRLLVVAGDEQSESVSALTARERVCESVCVCVGIRRIMMHPADYFSFLVVAGDEQSESVSVLIEKEGERESNGRECVC
jgi:hypothetical protein